MADVKEKPTTFIGEHPPRDGREWDCQCARCGSSMFYQRCEHCEDGYSGHDCGEDCCCCLDPEPNLRCDICHGEGGWQECASGYDWCNANPRAGREHIKPETPEWYTLDNPKDSNAC